MISTYFRTLLASGLALICLPLASHAQVARVVVTDEVIRTADQLPPLGYNNFGNPGGIQYSAGNLIKQPGFEPAVNREFYLVKSAGVDDQGRRWITLDGPGTSKYTLYRDGTWSGASMRAYRIVDKDGQSLPMKPSRSSVGFELKTDAAAKVVKMADTKVFAKGTPGLPSGGWLVTGKNTQKEWSALSDSEKKQAPNNWRVYYEGDVELRPVDAVIFTKNFGWPEVGLLHPRTYERRKHYATNWSKIQGDQKFVTHATPGPARMMGGDMYLELTPQGGEAAMTNNLFTSSDRADRQWYGQLEPGVTYRYEAWLRSDSPAQVELGFATNGRTSRGYYNNKIDKTFAVDSQWKLYGFEFVAPDRPASGGIAGPAISFTGDSPLHADNIKLQPAYKAGDENKMYVPDHRLIKAVVDSQPAEGPKGAFRGWVTQSETRMKSLLSWYNDSTLNAGGLNSVRVGNNTTMPRQLSFMEATGDSPETRVMPWLVVQIMFDEDEYDGLIEYLVAPYDPAKDTEASKPWAYMRYQQRGHGEPWLDTFRAMVIEFGNENWHNRKMANWVGFGHYGWVHQFGKEYGLFSRYIADQMRSSPYWTDEVGKKIQFSVGGNYSTYIAQNGDVKGYGQEATQAFKLPVLEGHATYVGPRWEMREESMKEINDDGFQRTMLGYLERKKTEWETQAASNAILRDLGYDVTMVGYESGPSGFGLDRRGSDSPSEVYGKSKAMAVAAFEGWLDAYRLGWTYQMYHAFGQGNKWRSHSAFVDGFYPSPGFLALTLRNREMRGDMVKVDLKGIPKINVGILQGQSGKRKVVGTDFPVIGAYAMRDGTRYSVAVFSRQLKGDVKAEIKVPFAQARKVVRYSLSGNPQDTNLKKLKVDLIEAELDATKVVDGVLSVTVPAGSIAVYAITAEEWAAGGF